MPIYPWFQKPLSNHLYQLISNIYHHDWRISFLLHNYHELGTITYVEYWGIYSILLSLNNYLCHLSHRTTFFLLKGMLSANYYSDLIIFLYQCHPVLLLWILSHLCLPWYPLHRLYYHCWCKWSYKWDLLFLVISYCVDKEVLIHSSTYLLYKPLLFHQLHKLQEYYLIYSKPFLLFCPNDLKMSFLVGSILYRTYTHAQHFQKQLRNTDHH